MNKVWQEPQVMVQPFVANEYVAACGDEGTVYNFECNAGEKYLHYNVFLNGDDDLAGTSDDKAWTTSGRYNPVHKDGFYSPCGETHSASTTDIFHKGYMFIQGASTGINLGKRIDVIVWTDNGTNTHCTTNLDRESWTTSKS